MKTVNSIAVLTAILLVIGTDIHAAGDTAAQSTNTVPGPTPYQVVSRGDNFNIWQWQTFEPLPNGQFAARTHSYTELAGGLNYLGTNGSWASAQELIVPYAQGAIAQMGQHRVIYATDINTASGVVDEETPDRKRLTSNVIGLMYLDPTTGQSVQIAEVQDSPGQLVADNQVLYTNAFRGINASVSFEYRRDGTEQCIILNAQPPAPEAFGLSSKNAELVVETEFLNPPPATVSNLGTNVDGEEPDEAISWGATSLGRGRAFSLGNQDLPATVIKQYTNINARYFLFEKVKYRDIQQALSALPLQSSTVHGLHNMASKSLTLPKKLAGKSTNKPMRLAHGGVSEKGYVLDYITLNSSYTDYTFQGGTTYYISGNVNLSYSSSVNVIEQECVLKFAAGASITIVPGAYLTFASAPGRPCLFTAKDDNNLGETISGSTGTPSGYYANPALNLGSIGSITLSDFRVAYASRGLSVSGADPTIYDAQFVNCATAVSDMDSPVTMGNVLFSNNKTNFNATSSANTVSIQNATFNNGFDLVDGSFGSTSFYLTNCVFVNMTNLSGTIAAGYNGFYNSPSVGSSTVSSSTYPLQRAGAANCYLANSSVFLNAGTSNINTAVLSLLNVKTVYPPIIYSNATISLATTFTPQAQRDNTGNPSPGYHYEPLDYVFGNTVAQSNLTFTAGTAAGWFYNSSGGTYGLAMGDSATASFNGTVTLPCHFSRYSLIQEGNGNWTPQSWLGGITGQSYTLAPPGLSAKFTIFSTPASEAGPYRDNSTLFVFTGNDCEFYGAGGGAYDASINATNCLYVNGGAAVFWNYGAANLTLENCTFFRGGVTADNTSGGYWPVTIVNCAFDSTTFYMNAHGGPTNGYYTDYNSFLVGSNTTTYLGGHEVYVTGSYNWQSSWFGDYYQPWNSPLIQKGSTTADQVGLYHFTTQTSQTPETNAVVDIGYHYVATDAYGKPLDTNGDGIPDYLEDANGNGLVDSGETGWNLNGDLGLKVIIARPRNGSVLP